MSPDEVVLPVCGFQAFPRQSRTGLRHFVHRTGTGCADHPGETPRHLAAKTVIVQAALQAGWDAVPEQPGPTAPGRAGPGVGRGCPGDQRPSPGGARGPVVPAEPAALPGTPEGLPGQRYAGDLVAFVTKNRSRQPTTSSRRSSSASSRTKTRTGSPTPRRSDRRRGSGRARRVGEGGSAFSVRVDQHQLPLDEVVMALLSGRIRFRELVGSGPGELVVELWSLPCGTASGR